MVELDQLVKKQEAPGYYWSWLLMITLPKYGYMKNELLLSASRRHAVAGARPAMPRLKTTGIGWQKLLYFDQDKPDNYVDHSFLKELRRNSNIRILALNNWIEDVPIYDYWQIVAMMSSFTQHLNSFIIFIVLFAYAYYNKMKASQMVILSELATFTGYFSWMLYVRSKGNVFRYQGNLKIDNTR